MPGQFRTLAMFFILSTSSLDPVNYCHGQIFGPPVPIFWLNETIQKKLFVILFASNIFCSVVFSKRGLMVEMQIAHNGAGVARSGKPGMQFIQMRALWINFHLLTSTMCTFTILNGTKFSKCRFSFFPFWLVPRVETCLVRQKRFWLLHTSLTMTEKKCLDMSNPNLECWLLISGDSYVRIQTRYL